MASQADDLRMILLTLQHDETVHMLCNGYHTTCIVLFGARHQHKPKPQKSKGKHSPLEGGNVMRPFVTRCGQQQAATGATQPYNLLVNPCYTSQALT
jgi:hypothetical protein